jgi:hypothetical protein
MSLFLQVAVDSELAALAAAIQMAIAPVFLLSGVSAFLGVLNSRLARVIDRTRMIEAHDALDDDDVDELRILLRRRKYINRAITMSTACALLVAIVIALMFLGIVVHFGVVKLVVSIFIASMIALIGALLMFLREIHLAVRFFRKEVIRRIEAENKSPAG